MLYSFNSNVVRLKVLLTPSASSSEGVFQFQCGTIKSDLANVCPCGKCGFQFQCGTIKRMLKNFSITRKVLFQFQCGTIKRNYRSSRQMRSKMFQFQCGTIKSSNRYAEYSAKWQVSIPMWYD